MIGVLTYGKPHRKTTDLVLGLVARGIKPHIITTLWEERKNHIPLYPHRPTGGIDPSVMAKNLGLPITHLAHVNQFKYEELDRVLIGGAGILPKEVISLCPFINAHPGLLPEVRGLDALKWSIYEDQLIGVTVHQVGEEADTGHVISRQIIEPKLLEDFYHLAMRVYELEIKLLIDSIEAGRHLASRQELTAQYKPHRRMKHAEEVVMMDRYKLKQLGVISWHTGMEGL